MMVIEPEVYLVYPEYIRARIRVLEEHGDLKIERIENPPLLPVET